MTTHEIHVGNSAEVLKQTVADASIDLICMDPPFNSGCDYKTPDGTVQFSDKFKSMDAYLDAMRPVFIECARVMRPDASVYVHVDDTASASLRCLLDEILPVPYRNTIIWPRTTGKNCGEWRWGRSVDHILFYSARRLNTDAVQREISDATLRNYKYRDARGMFSRLSLFAPGIVPGEASQPWRGVCPPEGRRWHLPKTGAYAEFIAQHVPEYADTPGVFARLELLDAAGFLQWPYSGKGQPRLKQYWTGAGCSPADLWSDIMPCGGNERAESGKYPTQKPVALLERMILASSDAGQVVLDPFCGSGTAGVAAKRLGRSFVGIDMNDYAADVARRRLDATEAGSGLPPELTAPDDTQS